eukprot:CAMPEP_0181319702 /NCGR_PEP_ID=MMETSP1101-20121128/17720_1 /TAXON_ID=46948 /ORGANISM="Rhodomonas abbreviata, Strain Caron Lab Isolate" /LENGTH=684 /DNA_ID=CAMNT_0023427335 /DNA_START=61 /DNA_END=2115 /DNA_ORIENTATION=-
MEIHPGTGSSWESSDPTLNPPFLHSMQHYTHSTHSCLGPIHPMDTGEMIVVVNTTSPYKIQHASQEWLDFFRYSRDEVAGRSIKIVQGPVTDIDSLKDLLSSAQSGKTKEAALTIYSSGCQGKVMCVKAAPKFDGENLVGSILTMHPSDAIPYKEACADDGTAKAVVSIKDPHVVEWVSPAFSGLYGFQEDQLQGRTLRVILGPNTDHHRWRETFETCRLGLTSVGNFSTCRHDCSELLVQLQVTPVFSFGGGMTHLLATFISQSSTVDDKPPSHYNASDVVGSVPADVLPLPSMAIAFPDHSSGTTPNACEPLFGHAPSDVAPPLGFGGAHQAISFPTNVTPFDCVHPNPMLNPQQRNLAEFFGVPSSNDAGNSTAEKGDGSSKVFPRRKHGQENAETSRGPVVITLELLESFASVSLTAAAKSLGISPTAVKKACRKLGVQRWPYRKNAEVVSENIGQYDEAYVRKLYRKYSKPSRAPSTDRRKEVQVLVKDEDVIFSHQEAGAHAASQPPPVMHQHPPALDWMEAHHPVGTSTLSRLPSVATPGTPIEAFGRLGMDDHQRDVSCGLGEQQQHISNNVHRFNDAHSAGDHVQQPSHHAQHFGDACIHQGVQVAPAMPMHVHNSHKMGDAAPTGFTPMPKVSEHEHGPMLHLAAGCYASLHPEDPGLGEHNEGWNDQPGWNHS